jgi:hypothetical protein
MQIIKSILKLTVFLCPIFATAQSVTLPEGDKSEHFLERMDIKQQSNYDLILDINKPLERKVVVNVALAADSLSKLYPNNSAYALSKVDQYDLNSALINNIEWTDGNVDGMMSKHTLFNTFYLQKANFYEVNEKDFFLAVNPVIQQIQSREQGNPQTVFLNSKGITLRGMIAGKLGFSAYLTDNQERGPEYFQKMVTASGFPAVPGQGYYKDFKGTGYDYSDNRASIYFNAWKYFHFQFGYDKNFIGDGYRSLILSDNSAPYLFLKFNMRIWKLNYENILMQLVSQHQLGDYMYPQKYGVIHHLSVNAARWLNVGIFQNVMFSRPDHFDFTYLNPVISPLAQQQANGSPDKSMAGIDFKANIAHSVQVYGQLIFNEFVLDSILHYSHGWWANKQGVQLGVKYIDMFKIKNLDLQLEGNIVRPFTYSHNDTVSNYSNYNQPMAHPLGANFDEAIGIIRYQPIPKLDLEIKVIAYRQGLDSAGKDFGSNIFINYDDRIRDNGFKVGSGILAKCVNANFSASYEFKQNWFFDLSYQARTYTVAMEPSLNNTSNMISVGLRVNAFKRVYDY